MLRLKFCIIASVFIVLALSAPVESTRLFAAEDPEEESQEDSEPIPMTEEELIEMQRIQLEKMVKMQQELKEIVSRSNQLQGQMFVERAKIAEILERAKIHERILRDIKIPEPVRTKDQIDIDRILAYEKIRFISNQTLNTERQLRSLKNAGAVKPIQTVTPPETKTS